ncbi:Zinc finger C-x8-C-x5-C-x3-H type (and similar) [Geosmithia morbida]|uniref:Zinc finger C-x8-C-x5-C-x3-H type (And similar) n=1 Tax=Geosmithia morbida TaxID=1094350 RepID=A0A9P4YPT8_9HYPO|nr:Zinc finger C-x8-C-x5-C-x3-H type (and similar) [Geosmithia morbida]KAF4120908.1 Zinc finger C-x8-C-x5-C-x3-H type (and similar) [Geosmithia morbida]
MPEYRHMRSGSLNIPNGQRSGGGAATATMGPPRFDGPRSPPNTSHVPCKFFRQGTCQAGNACPFSHDLGTSAETVCKYFAKGNCKFGPKCANIHVLPDGRRINYGKNGVTIGHGQLAPGQSPTSPTPSNSAATPVGAGGPHSPSPARPPTSSSALTNSLYRDDHASPFAYDDRHHPGHLGRQPSHDNGPVIDVPPYTRNGGSNYGSPRDDDSRYLGLSPMGSTAKGLSILDAPLPASFDSNGISYAALFPAAPWPSSVPSKFGFESPSSSLNNAKDSRTSETLKLLHTSAFGSEYLATPLAGSPTNSQYGGIGDEYFGKRTMHSSRLAARPRMVSASLPKATSAVDRDWEAGFAFDDSNDNVPENYVPENLQDLLTPAEKARRGSIRADDSNFDGLSKYGSPIGTSPGRWGPAFPRQKDDDDLSRSARVAPSAFGHVGSPLRNSTLAQEMGGVNGSSASSRRPSTGMRSSSESMSVLSQQLQCSRLNDAISPAGSGNSFNNHNHGSNHSNPHNPLLHPSAARHSTATTTPVSVSSAGKERNMERHVSSGSISSSVTGRLTTPIDEEDPDFVFSMEEEEDDAATIKSHKRGSSGITMGSGWGGSYASAVSGAKNGTTKGETKDADR